jgi:hypothetical protein
MGVQIVQKDDGSVQWVDDAGALIQGRSGGAPDGSMVAASTLNYRNTQWVHQKMAVTNASGGTASIANPIGQTCIISNALVWVRTASSVTTSLDIGVGSAATSSVDTLFDQLTVGNDAANQAGVLDTSADQGANGRVGRLWGIAQFVTATATATATSLVADLYVEYILI